LFNVKLSITIYLSEHPRANVSTALSLVNEKIEKLKVSGFVSIDVTDQVLTVRIDEKALKEESQIDGCYVIRSNLLLDQGHGYNTQQVRILPMWNGHSGQ
jgi:DNA-binding transcriptional regulator LsrR (DeoR family)